MNFSHLQTGFNQRLPEARHFLEKLVKTNSHTWNAAGVNANADLIVKNFSPFGFSESRVPCSTPGTGDHLVLDSGGEGPVVALISHLDTVYSSEEEARNDFHWQEEGSRVFGPGVYDIKGGTTMTWLLLSVMKDLEPDVFKKVRWMLLWNAAEEILVPDFAHVCRKMLPANTRCCLVFEGDGRSSSGFAITLARKGRGTFRIRVAGRGAHAGSHHKEGANAIREIARVIEEAERLTDNDRQVTVNVGSIRGGSEVNRVPHEAEARLEVRAFEERHYAAIRESLLSMGGAGKIKAQSDGFPCQIEVVVEDEIAPWSPNEGSEQLAAIWKQAAADCGYDIDFEMRGGLSDGNGTWRQFPTLDGLGPRGGNHHCSERSEDGSKFPEFVDSSSWIPKAMVNYLALRRIITSGPPAP